MPKQHVYFDRRISADGNYQDHEPDPAAVMAALGITYVAVAKFPGFRERTWAFFACDNVPDPLPPFLGRCTESPVGLMTGDEERAVLAAMEADAAAQAPEPTPAAPVDQGEGPEA